MAHWVGVHSAGTHDQSVVVVFVLEVVGWCCGWCALSLNLVLAVVLLDDIRVGRYVNGSDVNKHHIATWGEDFGYKDFIPLFTAPKFDADVWADLYQRAGARCVCIQCAYACVCARACVSVRA